jgi:uncharacterized protein YgbK (DUF1537 family)
MSVPTLNVLADDLTGAAEVAGIASRFGLKSAVLLDASQSAGGDVIVWDLDTRLQDDSSAGRVAGEYASSVGLTSAADVFVKVDSVLRGPVRSQLEALAGHLGAQRVMLAPANPSRGRIIVDGRYFVNGEPLHITPFAQDPHHPARSSNPSNLLGSNGDLPVMARSASEELPEHGIVIAEASSPDHVSAWARQLDATTLAAGAADFFTAILEERGASVSKQREAPVLPEPTLWICGSTASPSRTLFGSDLQGWVHYIPDDGDDESISQCAERIGDALVRQHSAILTTRIDSTRSANLAWIQDALTGVAGRLIRSGNAKHLLIEGGATAASVMRALGFEVLRTLHEWAPGIVSFSLGDDSGVVVTTKPGSYAWPTELFVHTKFADGILF